MNPQLLKFKKTDPDQNFPILRFISEDGGYEAGLMPVLYGVRVRAGRVGDSFVFIDYCAGADKDFQMRLLGVIIDILETLPVGITPRAVQDLMPGYKRRPIDKDPCWPALMELREFRKNNPLTL